MSAQSNAKMCQELYELFNKKDLDSALAMASEEIEVEPIPLVRPSAERRVCGILSRALPLLFPTSLLPSPIK